jgi:tRNA(Glu) U13 pseudouridine synthase TruD
MKEIHVTRVIESQSVALAAGRVLAYFRWKDQPNAPTAAIFRNEILYEDVHHRSNVRSLNDIINASSEKYMNARYDRRLVRAGFLQHMRDAKTQYLTTEIVEEFMPTLKTWGEVPDFEYQIVCISPHDGHVLTESGNFINDWFSFFVDPSDLTEEETKKMVELSLIGDRVLIEDTEILEGWIVKIKATSERMAEFKRDGMSDYLLKIDLKKMIAASHINIEIVAEDTDDRF